MGAKYSIDKIKNRIIASNDTLLNALKQMDAQKVKMLFVFADVHFDGIITIGDIQRAVIKNIPLTETVSLILNKNKKYAAPGESKEDVRKKMLSLRAECMPVVDEHSELVDVYFWADF